MLENLRKNYTGIQMSNEFTETEILPESVLLQLARLSNELDSTFTNKIELRFEVQMNANSRNRLRTSTVHATSKKWIMKNLARYNKITKNGENWKTKKRRITSLYFARAHAQMLTVCRPYWFCDSDLDESTRR